MSSSTSPVLPLLALYSSFSPSPSRELLLDLESDGVSVHFEFCGCVAEHLRGVVARGRL